MSDKIKVLVVGPMQPCRVQEIEDDLKAIQATVGGKFETVFPFDDSVAVVCNRDGKIDGLPFNRPLLDDSGEPYDIICGTFFITGVGGENFVFLTNAQISRYKAFFDNTMVVPDKEDQDIGRIVTNAKPTKRRNSPER